MAKIKEYPFLENFKKGDFIRVNNSNYRVTIDKRTNKKTLTKAGVLSPVWANKTTTYYDKDGAYYFQDGVKTKGIKEGSNFFNISTKNKNLTNQFKRYTILRNVDILGARKPGGIGGQKYEDFLKEIERKNYSNADLKKIVTKVYGSSASGGLRIRSENFSPLLLDKAEHAKKVLKNKGIVLSFKDEDASKLTFVGGNKQDIVEESLLQSEEEILTSLPYINAVDFYQPAKRNNAGFVIEGPKKRDINELKDLNQQKMLEQVSSLADKDKVPSVVLNDETGLTIKGNKKDSRGLSIVEPEDSSFKDLAIYSQGNTVTSDNTFEKTEQLFQSNENEDLNIPRRSRRDRVSNNKLPSDPYWEKTYGKKWALMSKTERTHAKRGSDLFIRDY